MHNRWAQKHYYGKILFTSILPLFALCCTPAVRSSIPSYPVYCEIDLNSSEAKDLRAEGGWMVVTHPSTAVTQLGFGGLLIIHSPITDGNGNTFYAYDAACPIERSAKVRLTVNDKLNAYCPKCHNEFSILYGGGNPLTEGCKEPLLRYAVYSNGSMLIIRNY